MELFFLKEKFGYQSQNIYAITSFTANFLEYAFSEATANLPGLLTSDSCLHNHILLKRGVFKLFIL